MVFMCRVLHRMRQAGNTGFRGVEASGQQRPRGYSPGCLPPNPALQAGDRCGGAVCRKSRLLSRRGDLANHRSATLRGREET
ncbi:hypothetical protein EVAR_56771_1 [Eumeta japonica]|uniref:Uncharacterized protein n=1 Tax=Eumeta variegata TaxID=151549 RepID=A0A4C1XRE7_EUMVA|nr:hypothetical protein EVAR_56771_1 [Eumeta japonica]